MPRQLLNQQHVASQHTRRVLLNNWAVGPGATDTILPVVLQNPSGGAANITPDVASALIGSWAEVLVQGALCVRTIVNVAVAPAAQITLKTPLPQAPTPGTPIIILDTPSGAVNGLGANGATNFQGGNVPTSGNNTINNPDNVGFILDVAGVFANNTITIAGNGTGMTTIIRIGGSMMGCNVSLTEGDSVIVSGDLIDCGISSQNAAGGCVPTAGGGLTSGTFFNAGTPNATWTPNFGGYPNSATIYLQAGTAGTLVLSPNCGTPWFWQLDGGVVNEVTSGNSTTIDISIGSHTLQINSGPGPTYFNGFSIGPFRPTTGSSSAPGLVAALTPPSGIRLRSATQSSFYLYSDTVDLSGAVANSAQFTDHGTGGSASPSSITVTQSVQNSTVTWQAPLTFSVGSLSGATVNVQSPAVIQVGAINQASVTVPSGISGTTSIAIPGVISSNLTTTQIQQFVSAPAWSSAGQLTPIDHTTTALAANSTYQTASAIAVGPFAHIVGSVYSDQSGTLQVQQSQDGQNWDVASVITYTGGGTDGGFDVAVVGLWARLVYQNGATAQTTFRLYAWGKPS